MLKIPQNLSTLLLGVLVINVIGLWTVYLISHQAQKLSLPEPISQPQDKDLSSLPEDPVAKAPRLVATGSAQIKELQAQLDQISGVVATLSAQPPAAQQIANSAITSSGTKEYIVYLGSGSTTAREWTEIEGTKTSLNTANYSSLKEVEFQASLKIIGGEVRARLKNKTTGAVLYESEVMHNSSTLTWVSRINLNLTHGNNDYVVELKSSSGELAQLEGARLRIMVE